MRWQAMILASRSTAGASLPTTDFARLADCDVIIICVPTPLTKHRDPDLSFIEATSASIAAHLRPGQLVVLESTTYPGTTDDIVKVILETTGLKSGRDFFVGFFAGARRPGQPALSTRRPSPRSSPATARRRCR